MRVHFLPRLNSRPTVSVVVPCYKYGHFLEAAVQSIISQADVDTYVVIVDDASPDDSPDVARDLAARYPNVTAIVHDTNLGHIATYNDGLMSARGEFVLLLSADDLLAPRALARATAIMQRFPKVGLVYGFAPSFLDFPPRSRRFLPHCTVWPGDEWITQVCRRGQNPVSTPTVVMRRKLIEFLGGYDARLPHTADLLMWLRSASMRDVAYVNGVDQAFYRVHGTNMHTTEFAQLIADLEQRRDAFRVFSEESQWSQVGDTPLIDATHALSHEAANAARRLDSSIPRAGEAHESLLAFVDRYAEYDDRWLPNVVSAFPTIRDRLAGVGGAVGWRYWRRFGLRL